MSSASTAPKRRKNALHAEQIDMMQNLTPRAAAWLADVPASTLRDSAATLTPDRDGNYDARHVLRWTNARKASQVSDEDLELIHRAVDIYLDHGDVPAIGIALKGLRSRYGRAVDGWFMDAMFAAAEMEGLEEPEELPDISDDELLERARVAYDRERNRRGQLRLDRATVCGKCGRLRVGNRWVKRKPKLNEQTIEGVCNRCSTYEDPFVVNIRDLVD